MKREMNTKISYLYRDAHNYKVHNECVVSGTLTKEQQKTILDCLDEGINFIPSLVGLPEVKFDEVDDPEVDHLWFELDEWGFEETWKKETVLVSASELIAGFCACKGKWMDLYLETPTYSLDDIIRHAEEKGRAKLKTEPSFMNAINER